jgi:ferredoxin--NADP+ reductase
MFDVGNESHPLRVAIIGAGPAGFYAAEHLFKQKDLTVEVDLFDRLPTPYGLVRFGVAPDHPKIKSVSKVFDRVASKPGFRYFGFVELGKEIEVADLRNYYHQIVYTVGAPSDRHLNIPGIDLNRSHAATEFVAWYNGHPDYRHLTFDLSQERVAVIGIGNVALDVARILSRTVDELRVTDIADYALEALAQSKVKEVHILGRRGPAQAKFTIIELKELGEMADADIFVLPDEAELDELSKASLAVADRGTVRKVEIIQNFANRGSTGKRVKLYVRFLVSPIELLGDEKGGVVSMRLAHNELYPTEAGTLRPRMTETVEELPVGLVFRSIGYRGIRLPGVPFNSDWGVILNKEGRVLNEETQQPVLGEYTAGWIKRGPTGVIGTNKPDSVETVKHMLTDLASGRILQPTYPTAEAAEEFIRERQPMYFSYEDWHLLNELEISRGKAIGRPRLKISRIQEMIEVRAAGRLTD